MTPSGRYRVRIRVDCELGPTWAGVFTGLALEAEPGGTTLLHGEVADQAAVHGILAAVRDLGLPLRSAETTVVETSADPASIHPMGGSALRGRGGSRHRATRSEG